MESKLLVPVLDALHLSYVALTSPSKDKGREGIPEGRWKKAAPQCRMRDRSPVLPCGVTGEVSTEHWGGAGQVDPQSEGGGEGGSRLVAKEGRRREMGRTTHTPLVHEGAIGSWAIRVGWPS